MAEHTPGEPRRVVSMEENSHFCSESHALLAELGLDEDTRIHHVPLERQQGGREVQAYALPASLRDEVVALRPDPSSSTGPGGAGGPYARWAVLHLVLPLLPEGFRFYLDDALSDSALEYAQLWDELPGVRIEGVALVGHGLLVREYRG